MIKKNLILVTSPFVRKIDRERDREKCENTGNLLLHFTTTYKESEEILLDKLGAKSNVTVYFLH